MNPDAEFDAAILRDASVAPDHRLLDFDRAAHSVDRAAKFDDGAVAGPLDHAAVMGGDGRIDQIAAQGAKPGERAVLVGAGEPAVADDIGGQDGRELSRFARRILRQVGRRPASLTRSKRFSHRKTRP